MDRLDVKTPNPCILTEEEQFNLQTLLKKYNPKLGTINLPPSAPSVSPYLNLAKGGNNGQILISNKGIFQPSTYAMPTSVDGSVNPVILGAILANAYNNLGISGALNIFSGVFDLNIKYGQALAQSGAVTNVVRFTPATATPAAFEIGGYIDVTAFTAGTISMTCAYTDPSNNAQTLTIPLIALNGSISTTVGSVTDVSAIVTSILTNTTNNITIATTVAGFTGTYNVYGWIKEVH